tara:strand:+ start:1283 stop:1990 length:708 start_codon:yes stop_codon:yes gene_type:complete
MKNLKNWDDNTWLSSKKYIKDFCAFVENKKKLKKDTKILDIGCGRAKIISNLATKYNFRVKPIGIDVIKHKDINHNIKFINISALKFLKRTKKFDLIIIKQTIHLMSKKDQTILLKLCKNSLSDKGKLLIFSLKTKNNQIPVFKLFKKRLNISLKKDKRIFLNIKKILNKVKISNFNFKVSVKRSEYIKMIKKRYISCLLRMTQSEINRGVDEIKFKYKNQIKFIDSLICITFTK